MLNSIKLLQLDDIQNSQINQQIITPKIIPFLKNSIKLNNEYGDLIQIKGFTIYECNLKDLVNYDLQISANNETILSIPFSFLISFNKHIYFNDIQNIYFINFPHYYFLNHSIQNIYTKFELKIITNSQHNAFDYDFTNYGLS